MYVQCRGMSVIAFLAIRDLDCSVAHKVPRQTAEGARQSLTSAPSCKSTLPLSITLGLLLPLLLQNCLSLAENLRLPVVDALEPVSEAGAAGCVCGIHPEDVALKEWAHLNAHLPEANGEAYEKTK